MTIRVKIDRLVIDPGLLRPAQLPQFEAALTQALQRLHAPPTEPPPRPRDALGRLAEQSARAIHQQMVRR